MDKNVSDIAFCLSRSFSKYWVYSIKKTRIIVNNDPIQINWYVWDVFISKGKTVDAL